MEQKLGNVARARQLYDASTVADPKHAAAWHGWGLLEKQQDNVLRARDIWLKVRLALCLLVAVELRTSGSDIVGFRKTIRHVAGLLHHVWLEPLLFEVSDVLKRLRRACERRLRLLTPTCSSPLQCWPLTWAAPKRRGSGSTKAPTRSWFVVIHHCWLLPSQPSLSLQQSLSNTRSAPVCRLDALPTGLHGRGAISGP